MLSISRSRYAKGAVVLAAAGAMAGIPAAPASAVTLVELGPGVATALPPNAVSRALIVTNDPAFIPGGTTVNGNPVPALTPDKNSLTITSRNEGRTITLEDRLFDPVANSVVIGDRARDACNIFEVSAANTNYKITCQFRTGILQAINVAAGPVNDYVAYDAGTALVPFVADGGADSDTLIGSNGTDTLLGNGGQDFIQGAGNSGLGIDVLEGDNLFLGAAVGLADRDEITGGSSVDIIGGGPADDRETGGDGNDIIGGIGDDAGDDTMFGGNGQDFLVGGTNPGSGGDEIHGGDGNDTIDQSNTSAASGSDLYGENGSDDIRLSDGFGGAGDTAGDRVEGGNGDDRIEDLGTDPTFQGGTSGRDRVLGNAGRDRIITGSGGDLVDGGADDDDVFVGDGDDDASGDSGNDDLRLGNGLDKGFAGSGSDSLNSSDPGGAVTETQLSCGFQDGAVDVWTKNASDTALNNDCNPAQDIINIVP